jgi:hypothetical protein
VVASYIRSRAGMLLAAADHNKRGIFPATAADAYRGLSETLWFNEFGDEPPVEMEDSDYYTLNINGFIDEQWSRTAAAEEAIEDAAWRRRMEQARATRKG